MPQFDYISKDKKGSTVRGREFAMTKDELITKLARRNLTIISIEEVIELKESEQPVTSIFKRKGIGTFDLVVLCKQLGSMVTGGVPIVTAIDGLAIETKNKSLKGVLQEVGSSIRDGNSLSMSLKKFPDSFSSFFIAIVEAGEKVGALDKMLERLSSYLSARDRINRKIMTALAYPTIIALFFICAMVVITLFLIPRFKLVYIDLEAKLPGLTLGLFKISDFMTKNIFWILSFLVIATFSLYVYFRTEKGRYLYDKMTLKIPIFGDIIMKASISKFARTLSTLLDQGISVTEALNLVGRTAGNKVVEKASLKTSRLITDGEVIPEALKKMEIFPHLMIQMAWVGVESGNLPKLLDKTADFYEDQVDSFISILTSIIEPILIVTLGLIFAIVVIALYLPIFKLGKAITGVAI